MDVNRSMRSENALVWTGPNAPINVKAAWGRGGGVGEGVHGVGISSNSLFTGKSFQAIATKFPHPGLHIAVHPKDGPKKGTIKISPNKTLCNLYL